MNTSRLPCSIGFGSINEAASEADRILRLWGTEPAHHITFRRGDWRFEVFAERMTNPLDRLNASEITFVFRGSRFVGSIPPIDTDDVTFIFNEEKRTVALKDNESVDPRRGASPTARILELTQGLHLDQWDGGDAGRMYERAQRAEAAFAKLDIMYADALDRAEKAEARIRSTIPSAAAGAPAVRLVDGEPIPDTELVDGIEIARRSAEVGERIDSAIVKLNEEIVEEVARRRTAEKRVEELESQLRDITRGFVDGRPTGVDLILRERNRQITEKGYGSGHDDEHTEGELARVACVYALPSLGEEGYGVDKFTIAGYVWPADWVMPDFAVAESDPRRIRELAKAGALIAAEIDRRIRRGDTIEIATYDPALDPGSKDFDPTKLKHATLRFVDENGVAAIAVGNLTPRRLAALVAEFVASPNLPVFVPSKEARKLSESVPEDLFETDIASAGEFEQRIRPASDFEIKRPPVDVPLHHVAPSAGDKFHEFQMSGVPLHGVPIAALLERAVRDLIDHVEMRRIKADEPPSALDREGSVEFARAVLEANRRLREGEGPFTLDACFIPRDPLTNPQPGDKYIVDGSELLVIERRQDLVQGKDFVTFVPIEQSSARTSPLFGFATRTEERCGHPSTVDIDVFIASVSTAESIGERGPRIFSHWTAVNLGPACLLNAVTGEITLEQPLDYLDDAAEIWSTIARVYADGSIGEHKRVSVTAASFRTRKFFDAMSESLAETARKMGISTHAYEKVFGKRSV